jgi:hypothetical protein
MDEAIKQWTVAWIDDKGQAMSEHFKTLEEVQAFLQICKKLDSLEVYPPDDIEETFAPGRIVELDWDGPTRAVVLGTRAGFVTIARLGNAFPIGERILVIDAGELAFEMQHHPIHNGWRASKADAALVAHNGSYGMNGENVNNALVGLFTDLMHLCSDYRVSFLSALEKAEKLFELEREENHDSDR